MIRSIHEHIEGYDKSKVTPPTFPIAYVELLAAMIGIVCFSRGCAGQIVRLNCDNSDAVAWLQTVGVLGVLGFEC